MKQKNLKIIPLGGLGEVGRNMMLLEWQNKILIIDVGFRLPGEDMPGIDCIIPNISYLKDKEKNILGIVFTHGHYDHIGAVPYLIDKLSSPPIYASALTKGIILKRQDEFPLQPKLNITEVKDGSQINLGPFKIDFFHQNHNIPGNLGLLIQTPIGNIMHTSDFKFDPTPVNDVPTDKNKLRKLGARRILLLMSDATGAENEGHSLSEKTILENLEEIFKASKGRIIAASFSSLINRIQQIIYLSEKYNRKVVIEGHGMKTNVEIAKRLKYLDIKKGTIIKPKQSLDLEDRKVTVLCTGAQGEGQAALMKIANKENRFIHLKKGDTVIFSSSVIPGNERTVQMLKDDILRQGTNVFHYKMMDIHAGGHAYQDELKELMTIIRPKFLLPIHGQYSMFIAHKEVAKQSGMDEKNVIIAENGAVINLSAEKCFIEEKPVAAHHVMVDGLGIGDVGEIVLRDRQALAKDGMFVIIVLVNRENGQVKGSPDIISRGFVYLKESKDLLYQTRKKTIEVINRATANRNITNITYVKDEVRNKIGEFLFSKTERRPMILPVIIEI